MHFSFGDQSVRFVVKLFVFDAFDDELQ